MTVITAPDVTDRAADATLECIGRRGLDKLTVDDVAREAGVSRATLYRAFPSRQALVASAIAREADVVLAGISAAAAGARDLDDLVARVLLTGTRLVRENAALAFVAAHEPELLYAHLEFAGGERLIGAIGRCLAPLFAGWCDDPHRSAEWVARIGMSLLWSPAPMVDSTDEAALRRFVATFVTPGFPAAKEA